MKRWRDACNNFGRLRMDEAWKKFLGEKKVLQSKWFILGIVFVHSAPHLCISLQRGSGMAGTGHEACRMLVSSKAHLGKWCWLTFEQYRAYFLLQTGQLFLFYLQQKHNTAWRYLLIFLFWGCCSINLVYRVKQNTLSISLHRWLSCPVV